MGPRFKAVSVRFSEVKNKISTAGAVLVALTVFSVGSTAVESDRQDTRHNNLRLRLANALTAAEVRQRELRAADVLDQYAPYLQNQLRLATRIYVAATVDQQDEIRIDIGKNLFTWHDSHDLGASELRAAADLQAQTNRQANDLLGGVAVSFEDLNRQERSCADAEERAAGLATDVETRVNRIVNDFVDSAPAWLQSPDVPLVGQLKPALAIFVRNRMASLLDLWHARGSEVQLAPSDVPGKLTPGWTDLATDSGRAAFVDVFRSAQLRAVHDAEIRRQAEQVLGNRTGPGDDRLKEIIDRESAPGRDRAP